MLNNYLQTVQGFIRDRGQRNINPDDLISYINRARREIAMRSQCVRVLTPYSGAIMTIKVTNPGHNYVNPSVVITPPDAPNGALPTPAGKQATAMANVVSGQIAGITIADGGDGYFQPQASITDPTGSGATLVVNMEPLSLTQFQQEIYDFSRIPLDKFAGVESVFNVHGVSIIYSNYRYSLPMYSFSVYQAMIRQYPRQYIYVPVVVSQLGQGTAGSLFLYPIASQQYPLELDCFCLPSDLLDDGSTEAIPMPWQEAVPLGACVYAYEELQNWNVARYWQEKYDGYVKRYSAYARSGRWTNPYGRY